MITKEFRPHRICEYCERSGKIKIADAPSHQFQYCFRDKKYIVSLKLCKECFDRKNIPGTYLVYVNIGIIGSRRYKNKREIERLIKDILNNSKYVIVVSGGAVGPDSWAENYAKEKGLKTKVFLPKIKKGMGKYEIINAYYDRNKKIAEYSDVIHAFVVDDKGGTWNTIKYAKKLKKLVIIHR